MTKDRYAARWLPEDGIIGQVAIERAISGEHGRPMLTRAESAEAIRILRTRGIGDHAAGRILGLSDVTVARRRKTYNITEELAA